MTTDFGATFDSGEAVAIQDDGKIVAAGTRLITNAFGRVVGREFALARYKRDGSLDASFGRAGLVTTGFPRSTIRGYDDKAAIAIQDDGRILLAGGAGGDFVLARYQPDGRRDRSFGERGRRITDFGGEVDEARALALQPDGRIVVAGGTGRIPEEDYELAVARYRPNGTLDPTFDRDGKLTTRIDDTSIANAVAVQPDGKIVAVGESFTGEIPYNPSNIALARYHPDGRLDRTFADDGTTTTNFVPRDGASSVALQHDGRIVVAGRAVGPVGDGNFLLARYLADGRLDPSFSEDGTKYTDFGGSGEGALAVALQSDGRIVAVGAGRDRFGLARYRPDGTLDPSFSGNGLQTTGFGRRAYARARAFAIRADGGIVAVGTTESPSTEDDFALARYHADGSLDRRAGGER